MHKRTFDAYVALFENKWAWPQGTNELRDEWRAQLWAKVEGWRDDYTSAFRRAADKLLAGRYARPTIDDIVTEARGIIDDEKGMSGVPSMSEHAKRMASLSSALNAALMEYRVTLRTPAAAIRRLLGCTQSELVRLWGRHVSEHQCPMCQFGLAYVLYRHVEIVNEKKGVHEVTRHVPSDRCRVSCAECRHTYTIDHHVPASWSEPRAADADDAYLDGLRKGGLIWAPNSSLRESIARELGLDGDEARAYIGAPRRQIGLMPRDREPGEDDDMGRDDNGHDGGREERIRKAAEDYIERNRPEQT